MVDKFINFNTIDTLSKISPDKVNYMEILSDKYSVQAKKSIAKTLLLFEKERDIDKRIVVLLYELYVSTMQKVIPSLKELVIGYDNLNASINFDGKETLFNIQLLLQFLMLDYNINKSLFTKVHNLHE